MEEEEPYIISQREPPDGEEEAFVEEAFIGDPPPAEAQTNLADVRWRPYGFAAVPSPGPAGASPPDRRSSLAGRRVQSATRQSATRQSAARSPLARRELPDWRHASASPSWWDPVPFAARVAAEAAAPPAARPFRAAPVPRSTAELRRVSGFEP